MKWCASRRVPVKDHSRGVRGRKQLVYMIADAVSGPNLLPRGKSWFGFMDHVAETVLNLARDSWAKSSVATRVGNIYSADIQR